VLEVLIDEPIMGSLDVSAATLAEEAVLNAAMSACSAEIPDDRRPACVLTVEPRDGETINEEAVSAAGCRAAAPMEGLV